MSITYSAEEIFQIGIEIELNGKRFYQAAAEAEQDMDMRKLFKELADWEAGHVEVFEKLKKKLPAQSENYLPYDPEDQYHRYLKAVANTHVFIMSDNVLDLAAKCESSMDVLLMALQFEKDSIVLYTTMKKLVPEHLGRGAIDNLINEEINHVSIISEKIKNPRPKGMALLRP